MIVLLDEESRLSRGSCHCRDGDRGGWGLGATVLTAGLGLVFIRASTAPEELRTT
jgi:hypothetical protein